MAPRGGLISALGITGVPEMNVNFAKLDALVKSATLTGLAAGGRRMKEEWQKNIEDAGWAPGHAPMDPRNDPQVQYYESIEVGKPELGKGAAILEVYSTLEARGGQPFSYPVYQEYGTSHNPPVPTMTPAFDNTKDEVKVLVAESVASVVEATFPAAWRNIKGKFLSMTNLKSIGGSIL